MTANFERNLTLEIKSDLVNVRLVCLSVRSICQHFSLEETLAYQMELCVDEALNNIIEHGLALEPDHKIRVHLSFTADRLMIQITYGPSKPWPDAMMSLEEPPPNARDFPERGFGNYLLTKIMDHITINSTKEITKLHLVKNIPGLCTEKE